MKDRPILFSGPMVLANLQDKKTQTRRVVKPQPDEDGLAKLISAEEWHDTSGRIYRCPYGKPGDRLWVRERWAAPHAYDHLPPRLIPRDVHFHYAATEDRGGLLWRPSIHMTRWASRLTLEITRIRVERLKEISREDAIAEGIERIGGDFSCCPWRNYLLKPDAHPTSHCSSPQYSYMTLWESINGKGSWDLNPIVWVVEYKRVKV